MGEMMIAVSGTYPTGVQAEVAVAHLKESGFPGEDISRPVEKIGGFLLRVQCNTSVSASRAENLLLRQTGARDVASSNIGSF